MVPGEIKPARKEITINEGKNSITLKVANTGDRAIQVGSHYHFFEVNKALKLDREKAYGMHLDIASGTSVRFEPGEEKEVKLVLTKTMTNENAGVVNNRAEIAEDYNEYGNSDINSTPNNNISGENDMGAADVIIGVSTGGSMVAYIVLVMINTILIAIAIRLMIKNKIIRIKKERR